LQDGGHAIGMLEDGLAGIELSPGQQGLGKGTRTRQGLIVFSHGLASDGQKRIAG
jgi:hypothetical protein